MDLRRGALLPETVADFAFLHMTDEEGRPIRPAPHHWLWLDLLCNEDIKKLLIIAPPESAKTTWILAYLATTIAFFPEWPRIMAAVSGPTADKRSQALRVIVESEEFRLAFPEVRRAVGLRYVTDEWSLAEGGTPRPGRIHPTMFSVGVAGAITGARARLLVGDDLLDNENTRTAHMRDYVHNWIHNSFLSRRLSRVGRAVLIGTSWHFDDAYARLQKAGDWVVCHIPLLSEGEEVYANITYPDTYRGIRIGDKVGQADLGLEVT